MLTNHRGILIFVTAAGFVFFPLQYIFTVIKPQPPGGYDLFGSGDIYTVSSIMFLFAMNAVLPVIMALLSNSYMHSKKASDFYHSLPVSRTRLLVADNAAGLTVTLTPLILNFAITYIAKLVRFGTAAGDIAIFADLLLWIVSSAAIYAITVLMAVSVGTTFDALIFSLCFNVCLPVIYLLTSELMQEHLYGYAVGSLWGENALMLSPILAPSLRLIGNSSRDVAALIIWAVVAAAAAILSIAVYKRRKSELSGKIVSGAPIQIAVKAIVAYCAGIGAGFIFEAIFGGKAMFITGAVIGCVFVYVLAEAVISRGFRKLIKNVPAGIAVLIVTMLVVCSVFTGGVGYENRVPAADDVASVNLGWTGITNTSMWVLKERHSTADEEEIYPAAVTADRTEENERFVRKLVSDVRLESEQAKALVNACHASAVKGKNETGGYVGLTIEYTLKNGKTMKREYRHIAEKAVEDLLKLEGIEEFKKQVHPILAASPEELVSVTVSSKLGKQTDEDYEIKLEKNDAEILLSAAAKDLSQFSSEDIVRPSGRYLGTIYLNFKVKKTYEGQKDYDVEQFDLYSDRKNVIDALKQLGLYGYFEENTDDVAEIYVSERQILDNNGYNNFIYNNALMTWAEDSYPEMIEELFETVTDPERIEQLISYGRRSLRVTESEKLYVLVINTDSSGSGKGYESLYRTLLISEKDAPAYLKDMFSEGGVALK